MTQQKPRTEVIPSAQGELSALASANAPFVYFDLPSTWGCQNGVVNITLEAMRHLVVDGEVRMDRVVAAHLRCPVSALDALQEMIAHLKAQQATPEGGVN